MAIRLALLSLLLLVQAPAPPPPVLSEVEQLRVQNAALEKIIVQRAMTDWQAKMTALKADLEKAHPGWSWNPDTGAWTAVPDAAKK